LRLHKIYQKDFLTWDDYYFQYQKNLAREYYIPLLKNWGVGINGKTILDIGCGNGGFITAFSEYNCSCTGVEINNFNWKIKDSVEFLVGDITDSSFNKYISKKYHLIILRDVIEHIPLDNKTIFLESVLSLMSKQTKLLITFPPFYSAFGLHQQSILKSKFKYFPFLSLFPHSLIKIILGTSQDKDSISKLKEIKNSRMTINHFTNLIFELGFEILNSEKYFVRPSHEIRYGLKMRKIKKLDISILNEFLISGCTYLLRGNVSD